MTDLFTSGERALGARLRPAPSGAGGIDLATLFGLGAGFALIATAIALGGSLDAFFDLPSVLIVVGGTLAVTAISYSTEEVLRAQPVLMKALVHKPLHAGAAALRVLRLADVARQHGPIHLESQLPLMAGEPYLQRAIQMVVDGIAAEEVQRVMTSELEATLARHAKSAGVLRRAAEVAPAMGLIGTLVGLVQMLGHLEDPKAIGPGMAVALLTTFYGALAAHVALLPLAGKLERNSAAEALVSQVHLLGALSIARQENPRRLETMLNTVLPPAQRVRYFD